MVCVPPRDLYNQLYTSLPLSQGIHHSLLDGLWPRDFITIYRTASSTETSSKFTYVLCPRDFIKVYLTAPVPGTSDIITVYLMTSDQGTPSRTVYLTASVPGTSKIICYLTAFVPGTSSQLTAFVPTCTIICLPDGLCPRDFITMFNSAKERTPSSSTVQRLYVICTCSNISS